MKFRALLLGSAATFAFAGGNAMAADLSVGEPVDFVRVCDAFGSGFWYIPQTDVCVAIGSRVRLAAEFDDSIDTDYQRDWAWKTKADVNLTMAKMTDWGPLTTYISFDSEHVSGAGDSAWLLDEAYFSIGPATVGYTGSVSNAGVGFTESKLKFIDADANVINLAFEYEGVGFFIGIENPADRWGSSHTGNTPDLSLAIEASLGGIDLFGSALVSDACGGSYAIAGTAETSVGMLDLGVGAGMVDGCSAGGGFINKYTNDGWGAGVSAKVNWTDTFQTAGSVWWMNDDAGGTDDWAGAATVFFQPHDGMEVYLDAGFDEDGLGVVELEVAVQLN